MGFSARVFPFPRSVVCGKWSQMGFRLVVSGLMAVVLPAHGTKATVPQFATEIAPILFENCVSCHRPEGVGPFSLIRYEDARRYAEQIAEVVESRYMPPWKPDVEYGPRILHARGLADKEIDALTEWAAAGAPSGDLSLVPKAPSFVDGWTLGQPDLILEMPQAFELAAEGGDAYRNFAIPIPQLSGEKRFVKAVEFLPQSRLAIHHATVLLDESGWAREQDRLDPGPGFGSMNLSGVSNPAGQFIGWTPGSLPYEVYPGSEWELPDSGDFIAQLHLIPTGKPEKIAPKIGIYFSKKEPTLVSSFLLLSSRSIDIPAGEKNYSFREQMVLPIAANILGVYPHAHYLGKELELFATLPSGEMKGIIRIPDWDFNWQSDYRFEKPIVLPAGTRLTMDYSYDNSSDNPRNPSDPPQRVVLGWNSTDEMGEMVIHFFVETPEDHAKINEAQLQYNIAQEGGTGAYFYGLGTDYEQAGLLEEADAAYAESINADPGNTDVLTRRANVLDKLGRISEAETAYRQAFAIDPDSPDTQISLGRFLFLRKGDAKEGAKAAQEVLRRDPDHFQASLLLASIFVEQQWYSQAVKLLENCLSSHPDEGYLRLQLGQAYFLGGDLPKAKSTLSLTASRSFSNQRSRSYTDDSDLKATACYTLALVAQKEEDVDGFRSALKQALNHNPRHADALLGSIAFAYLSNDADAAGPHLETLLNLSENLRPPIESLLPVLPFPEGPITVAKIHIQANRRQAALQSLQAAASFAQKQNRLDWASRFKQFAYEQGL